MLVRSLLSILALSATVIAQTPRLFLSVGDTVDQQIELRVKGGLPFQIIELRAQAEDANEVVWASKALFRADHLGVVDVASSTPLKDSSYAITDPMGLFWAMSPIVGEASSSFKCKRDIFSSTLGLYVNGQLVDQAHITQYLKKPEIQKIDIRDNGLVGTLFLPESDTPLPIVITLSGSNGGISENRAKLLASHRFAVLALGYFGIDGLPPNLEHIPLEYFEQAFTWLKNQINIDGSHVGLYGVSRGAELSLILGSLFPDSVHAIVAVVPSSVVYGGLGDHPIHAWLYKGKPIAPFAPVSPTMLNDGRGQTAENPANTRQSFLEGMKERGAFEAAAIPVENIQCPLLLISAGDDQMWPSEIYANQILTRLKAKHSQVLVRHLTYPDAGHGIGIPHLPIPEPTYYHPVGKVWLSMGGSREADAKASFDAWNHLVAFFHESLH